MKPTILRFVVLSLLPILGVWFLDAPRSKGQPLQKEPPKPIELSESFSAIHCIGCHGGKGTPAYKEYEKQGSTRFVTLEEYVLWSEKDFHSKSTKNLETTDKDGKKLDNIASRMERKLGDHIKLTRRRECLACHATALIPEKEIPKADAKCFSLAYGVSCEACHGHAAKWIGPHVQKDSWREKKTPAEKTTLGMVDLRDATTRAKKCASCHVGNLEEGRHITHAMYMAGHPPLPPFELATFLQMQPRHAYSQEENAYLKSLPEGEADRLFHYRSFAKDSSEVRALAVGAIVSFRETVNLIVGDPKNPETSKLLDFAHFDCYACHHELKIPSDRQTFGFAGAPGRPVIHLPVDLLRSIAAVAKLDNNWQQNFEAALKQFNLSFDHPPFGDKARIAEEGKNLVNLADQLLDYLKKIDFNESNSRLLLNDLKQRISDRAAGVTGSLDHESAQQLVWALEVLRKLKNPTPTKAFDGILSLQLSAGAAADSLAAQYHLRSRERENFKFADFSKALGSYLKGFDLLAKPEKR